MNRRLKSVLEAAASGKISEEIRARASWILGEESHARKRKLGKSLPRRKAAEAGAVAAKQKRAELRARVFERANGRCECCNSRSPAEAHHLVSGPSRRFRESYETLAALCSFCHLDLHRSRVDALDRMYRWAFDHEYAEAAAALGRRLNKLKGAA